MKFTNLSQLLPSSESFKYIGSILIQKVDIQYETFIILFIIYSFFWMTLKYYFDQQKKLYTALIEYINDQDNDETKYQNIIKKFKDQKFGEKHDDTVENLHMLVKVWENHHRTHTFLNKIKRILLNFKSKIKETLSNTKIFKIVQSDKLLLLFIIQNNFIIIDESISRML